MAYIETTLTPEQLRAEASSYQDDNQCPGNPGYCEADAAVWRFIPAYPLDRLVYDMPGGAEGWRRWFADELAGFRADGEPERADAYEAMTREPIAESIVVLERDGKGYIWDGNHRTAASFVAGRANIPAIVGAPLSEEG